MQLLKMKDHKSCAPVWRNFQHKVTATASLDMYMDTHVYALHMLLKFQSVSDAVHSHPNTEQKQM